MTVLNRPEGAEKLSGKAHRKGFKIRKRGHHGTSGIIGRFQLRLGGVSDIGDIGQRITDRLLEAGVIDGAQLEEYRAWLDRRPAGVPGLHEGFGRIGLLFGSGRLIDGAEGQLDRLVERGVIDETQADEYLDWYRSRPEGISPLIPGLK